MAVGCNNAVYLGQTVADKTVMNPLKQFKNGWSMQNTGTCAWDEDYTLRLQVRRTDERQ